MNQWALVTGAGTGIGRAIAEQLLERGIHIIAVGRREEPLHILATKYPKQVKVVPADLTAVDGREKVMSVVADVDQLNYLVHNAATVEPTGDLLDADPEHFSRMMTLNVEAPLFLTQDCVKHMGVGARILHISSGAAHYNAAGIRAYSVSKAAFYNMFLGLREELHPRGIGVLSIRPGVVDTPMQATMRDQHSECDDLKWAVDIQDRLVPPSTVGAFVGWLLCDLNQDQLSTHDEWDIYDESHHGHWVNDETCPVNPKA